MKMIPLLVLGLALSACGKKSEITQKAPLRPVKSLVVGESSGLYQRIFSGELRSQSESTLSFKVAGSVKKVLVKVGGKVKKGDILGELDPTPYQLSVQQANANLVQSQATFNNQKANFERTQTLYESGNVSRTELDDSRAGFETARAVMASAKKSHEIAKLNLEYTRIKSEGDCSVASSDVEEGETVALGQPIFFVTCGEGLEVKIDIPESVISKIKLDMAATMSFPALDKQSFNGRVSEVGSSAIRGSSTFPVAVQVIKPNSELKAGMSARVTFALETEKTDANSPLVIPPFAVGEDGKGRFVYVLVVENESVAITKRQPVEIGNILGRGIEIISGLTPGVRIVTAGVSMLRDGVKVKYAAQ